MYFIELNNLYIETLYFGSNMFYIHLLYQLILSATLFYSFKMCKSSNEKNVVFPFMKQMLRVAGRKTSETAVLANTEKQLMWFISVKSDQK